MGRRHDPHIGRQRFIRPDAGKRTILQHPQQLHLDRERHVADFVQKQRAAVRLLETSSTAGDGPGERTLFMTEKLALQQILRNRPAVDGDHFPLAARTVFMHRLRHQLLAGATFPGDQNRRVRPGDTAHELKNFLQGPGNPDHFHPSVVLRHFRIWLPGTAAVILRLQRGFHHRPQFESQRLLS